MDDIVATERRGTDHTYDTSDVKILPVFDTGGGKEGGNSEETGEEEVPSCKDQRQRIDALLNQWKKTGDTW